MFLEKLKESLTSVDVQTTLRGLVTLVKTESIALGRQRRLQAFKTSGGERQRRSVVSL